MESGYDYSSWDMIVQMYPNKWVILGNAIAGQGYAPQGGVLLAVEDSQEQALLMATHQTWQQGLTDFRVVYTGNIEIPEDTVLSLSYLSHIV